MVTKPGYSGEKGVRVERRQWMEGIFFGHTGAWAESDCTQ